MRKASFLSTNKQPTRALTLYRLLNSGIMRHFYRLALAVMLLSAGATAAQAQYYEIANQLPSLLQPALSGSMRYKGFVEAGYVKGIGNYNADFLGFSTSQGFQYSSWFFMGVGIGADVLFSHTHTHTHTHTTVEGKVLGKGKCTFPCEDLKSEGFPLR